MSKILTQGFFKRPAQEVAEDLLGKIIVRRIGKKRLAVRITELEIYDGFKDLASHASKGQTPRNKIMFAEGGYFYIYLVYGMYYMINITTGEKNYPSAILLRGGTIVSKLKNLPTYKLNNLDPADLLSYLELKFYLQNQLLKDTDFMSMYHSIEVRVPFLDHKLVEYLSSLPSDLKLSKKLNKPLLIEAISDLLPQEIFNRPKMGFTVPSSKWLQANNWSKFWAKKVLEKF